jgi:hypothetical protein
VPPKELDVKGLQQTLLRNGAYLGRSITSAHAATEKRIAAH